MLNNKKLKYYVYLKTTKGHYNDLWWHAFASAINFKITHWFFNFCWWCWEYLLVLDLYISVHLDGFCFALWIWFLVVCAFLTRLLAVIINLLLNTGYKFKCVYFLQVYSIGTIDKGSYMSGHCVMKILNVLSEIIQHEALSSFELFWKQV